MVLIFVVLILHVGVIQAQNIGPWPAQSKGCRLSLNSGWDEIEPIGDPLLIHVIIRVLHLTDIPDSGGFFSVDVM